MRRSAVIFVLIFTLLFTSVVTGCGAGSDSGTGNPSGSAGEAGQSAPSEGSGKTGESGKTDDAGNSDASGKSDEAGKTGDASSIPDTNETAASDWGVSDTGTADNSADAQSTFSQVLVDTEDLYFAIKQARTDAALGYEWKVYIENRTDQNLMFSFEKVSVNGVMCDPFWAEIVCAGKSAYSTVLWDHNSLEENDIAKIEQISLPLTVYSDENIANPYVDETFELTPGTQE